MSTDCTPEYAFRVAATTDEVMHCQSLRREVFVKEQKIPAEAEDDGKDGDALHIMCTENGQLIATGRVLITCESQVRADLARVAVRADPQRAGLGESDGPGARDPREIKGRQPCEAKNKPPTWSNSIREWDIYDRLMM